MPDFHLREWTPRDLPLPRPVVDQLLAEHADHLTVLPQPGGSERWTVRPQARVGSITVDDHRFVIQPKVALPNLLALMDVPIASEALSSDEIEVASHEDLYTALVRLFATAVEATIRRGVRRDYLTRHERLLSPRGRIDVRALARRPGIDTPVPCVYDDHTADVPLNRTLRAALDRAVRSPGLEPRLRRRMLLDRHELDDVESRWDREWACRWEPAPMERHYRASMRLARWLLEGGSSTLRAGEHTTTSFLLDMNKLFEDFVTRTIREALPRHVVQAEPQMSLGIDGAVTMKPDIRILDEGRIVAVADCKYKVLDDELARVPDYYQTLAYATACGLDEAWLIYVRGPSDPELREVDVRNSPVVLRTVSVDLTHDVDAVREQLSHVARRLITDTSQNLIRLREPVNASKG